MRTPVGSMLDALREAVAAVEDPELPVSLGDLGMLREVGVQAGQGDRRLFVRLRPTFLGCPARFLIEAEVRSVARQMTGRDVEVRWESADSWSVADITATGREQLKAHGVAVDDGVGLNCPYCGSTALEVLSERGVALCRRLAFCNSCRSTVDIMGPARATACGVSRWSRTAAVALEAPSRPVSPAIP